jgi:hypothetical protein
MSVYKEKVIYGEPPAGMVSVEDTARILKIDKKNVCGTMRKYGYESCLYTTASTKNRKAYYSMADIVMVQKERHLKHNSPGPVVAFNNGVKNGMVYRYSSIWMFRRELKRKFGVSITIRQCHEMLQNGTSFEGWFIDEAEED